MAQPQWITPVGSLGVIPEGVFYNIPVQASAGAENVYFRLIAGRLPAGIQVTLNGYIQGIPRNTVSIQGVPTQVSRDVTSQFAIRAYTNRVVNGQTIVDRLSDRTFSITVAGQDVPDFVTPPGRIGSYYDGTEVETQIEFTDNDPDDTVVVKLLSGSLPPGLVLTKTGLIIGAIKPLVGPPGTALPGYDSTPKDIYPNDFSTRSASKNFQFTVEITDGKDSNLRTFEIFVYSRDSMTADTTDFTADNTFITADVVPTRTPVILTPEGDLGRVRADNYYAFKFDGIDFDGDVIEYTVTLGPGSGFDDSNFDTALYDRGAFTLPPGLTINPDTGWFYGYIPNQGFTENSYRFAVRVFKRDNPDIISNYYYYTITIVGNVDTEVTWLTDSDLGSIDNGAISTLAVEAVNTGGRSLQYRLLPGSNSSLPQGLTLQPTGHITGRVSFNTFALDNGSTTFDENRNTRLVPNPTTFDLVHNFTVNAFAFQTAQVDYSVGTIIVTNGGSGYASQPTVVISAPPGTAGSEQATAGVATIIGGVIVGIEVGNPGLGYTTNPTVTITGGGGVGASAVTKLEQSQITNGISVSRTFTVRVNRVYNQPYESLYIKAMPTFGDRALLTQLLQNQNIIPTDLIYRADDPNFGVAKNVTYTHAYGLTAATLDDYVTALQLNHYWKNLTLGAIKTARAIDDDGNILYEVVYSEVVDDLINSQGQSVSKSVTLPYPTTVNGQEITTVYPNSLINMRDQVIDTVGQLSPILPLWMTSKQINNNVLGFTPAWVIAYVVPGAGGKVVYEIQEKLNFSLNIIDYKADRYELDRSQTHNWNSATGNWIPSPPTSTYFDGGTTVFDGNSLKFTAPADRWTNTNEFDKYLVFPKTNILG
jgi:hypothetical protein